MEYEFMGFNPPRKTPRDKSGLVPARAKAAFTLMAPNSSAAFPMTVHRSVSSITSHSTPTAHCMAGDWVNYGSYFPANLHWCHQWQVLNASLCYAPPARVASGSLAATLVTSCE